jgi:hypothetical protein
MIVWTIRLEGRRTPFLEIPHHGPETVRLVEFALVGVRAAGLVAIVNFTRTKKQVTSCPTTNSA